MDRHERERLHQMHQQQVSLAEMAMAAAARVYGLDVIDMVQVNGVWMARWEAEQER